MSNINTQSAIEAARTIEALIPRRQTVGLLITVPGSTHSARGVYSMAALAAWREAVLVHVSEQMTSAGGPIDFEAAKKMILDASDMRELEAMTAYVEWMPLNEE